jgi:hypothetical protein
VGVDVAGASVDSAEALAGVRWWWREQRPGPGIWRRLDLAYTVAITVAILGTLVYGTASSALAQVVTPNAMAAYGPAGALLALLVVAQWGAYQGPVVFSVADVAYLLGAPLPRRGLAWRRLARGLAAGAGAAAVVAAVLLVGLAGEGRGVDTARALGFGAGIAELGVLGVAAAWAVESSARRERLATRAIWPAVLVAAGLAALSRGGGTGRTFALWSGPWGWAVQPATGIGASGWGAALAVLTVVTVAAAVAAIRACGDCPAERHMVRAEARAGAVASLMSFDARSARRAFEGGSPGRSARGGGAPLRRLRRALVARHAGRLAIVWRDAVGARRAPGRVLEACVLVAAGTVLALLEADRAAAVLAAMLLVYAGAARMLWPMRAELDLASRTRVLLRPAAGRVLAAHMAVPALVAAGAAALGAIGCAVAGGLRANGAVAAMLAVAAAPVAVACAASSARRRGQLPQSVFVTSVTLDPTGGAGGILMWLALWPALAAGLGAVPILVATRSGSGAAVVPAAIVAAAAVAIASGVAREPDE